MSGFNNQQILLIFGLVREFTNQTILWRPDFFNFNILFSRFSAFLAQKMAKFGKIQCLETSRAKISKMREKIRIPASTSFLYYQNMQVTKKSW